MLLQLSAFSVYDVSVRTPLIAQCRVVIAEDVPVDRWSRPADSAISESAFLVRRSSSARVLRSLLCPASNYYLHAQNQISRPRRFCSDGVSPRGFGVTSALVIDSGRAISGFQPPTSKSSISRDQPSDSPAHQRWSRGVSPTQQSAASWRQTRTNTGQPV